MVSLLNAVAFTVGVGGFMEPYDGDTVRVKFRLAGVDTPEIKGSCEHERKLARKAQRFTSHFIKSGPATITVDGVGRYGRPLAVIVVNGKDLGAELIKNGLAVPYGKKGNWCQRW